jgi:hypothetical protein
MIALNPAVEMESTEELVEVQLHLHCIARSELSRHRNRLASLTDEQQSAVETLLMSMVDSISRQVASGTQSYPETVRKKTASVWRGAFPMCLNAKPSYCVESDTSACHRKREFA